MNQSESRIQIHQHAELGLGMLIADCGEGQYLPIGVVMSMEEAREIAAQDMGRRMRDLAAGQEPACPEGYVVWAQGPDGDYREVMRLES